MRRTKQINQSPGATSTDLAMGVTGTKAELEKTFEVPKKSSPKKLKVEQIGSKSKSKKESKGKTASGASPMNHSFAKWKQRGGKDAEENEG